MATRRIRNGVAPTAARLPQQPIKAPKPTKPTKSTKPKAKKSTKSKKSTKQPTMKIYPRITSPTSMASVVSIVGSPRSGQGRMGRNWKDSTSVHSSQTMQTSTTDSSYSHSNSSPGSTYDERPILALQMQHIEPIVVEENSSDGSRKSKDQRDSRKSGCASLPSGRADGPQNVPQRVTSQDTSSDSSSQSPSEPEVGKTRSSLHSSSGNQSSAGSGTGRPPTIMVDVSTGGKDIAASFPRRQPTHEEDAIGDARDDAIEEANKLQYDLPDLPNEDPETSDDQEEENETEDTSHCSDHGDKLSPLLDPVSGRLQKLDNQRQQSQQQSSVGTEEFSASYGSVSLGGDTSLSSADSFNNSPYQGTKQAIETFNPQPHKPNLQAEPQKKILKPNPNPNPIGWSRWQPPPVDCSNGDDNRRSWGTEELGSSSSSGAESSSSNVSSSSNAAFSSDYASSDSVDHSSEDNEALEEQTWEATLNADQNRDTRKGFQKKCSSGQSVDSGDISIDTFSDEGSRSGDVLLMVSAVAPMKPDESQRKERGGSCDSHTTFSADGPKKQDESNRSHRTSSSQQSSGTLHSSVVDTSSWNTCHEDAMLSVTTDDDGEKVEVRAPPSYSSWTSSESLWSNKSNCTWKRKHGNLNDWTSGDDDTTVSGEEEARTPVARRKADPNKPRSAFDMNAPLHGEDDDEDPIVQKDSMNSDSSSVLNCLGKKKQQVKPAAFKLEVPTSNASLSCTDFVKRESMTLADIANPSFNKEKTPPSQPEASASLVGLLSSKDEVPKKKPKKHMPKTMPSHLEESMSRFGLLNAKDEVPKKKPKKHMPKKMPSTSMMHAATMTSPSALKKKMSCASSPVDPDTRSDTREAKPDFELPSRKNKSASIRNPPSSKAPTSPKKTKKKSKSLPVDHEASVTANEENDASNYLEAGTRSSMVVNEASKKFADLANKVIESTLVRRSLYSALALFLLLDIILVIVIVTK